MAIKRTILFNEALHRYTDEDNNIYTSVTTLIGQYTPKFDEDYWAKYKAKQANVSVEVIKQNWKDTRDFACEKGNKTHKLLEDSINNSSVGEQPIHYNKVNLNLLLNLGLTKYTKTEIHLLAKSPMALKYPTIFNYIKQKLEEEWILFAEKRVYWYEYLVAGTIDCLLVKGKQFIIVDWKTNKDELKFEAGYYKKVNNIKTDIWVPKKEYFLKPLNYIEYCKGKVYTMQLSLYAYILELWGFECIDLILYHIRDNVDPKPYKILYDKSSCEILLIDFKNGSTKIKNNNIGNNNSTLFGIT